MFKYIKQYFIFTKRERNGTYILLVLLVILIAIRYSIGHKPVDQSEELEKFKQEIAAFEASAIKKENEPQTIEELEYAAVRSKKTQPVYFTFNPNTATINDWKKLGLSEKQAFSIIKYLSKGGKFKTKSDVKKMYVISDEKYTALKPYIDLPDKLLVNAEPNKKDLIGDSVRNANANTIKLPAELNIISKYKLTTNLNVKPELAEEIIKYRNFLRGYQSIDQLMEIETMDSTSFREIKQLLKVNPNLIRKININSDTSRELWHPYISKSLQKNMFNYRQIHGDYNAVEDIKKLALINDELYRKLVPYLTVE